MIKITNEPNFGIQSFVCKRCLTRFQTDEYVKEFWDSLIYKNAPIEAFTLVSPCPVCKGKGNKVQKAWKFAFRLVPSQN